MDDSRLMLRDDAWAWLAAAPARIKSQAWDNLVTHGLASLDEASDVASDVEGLARDE